MMLLITGVLLVGSALAASLCPRHCASIKRKGDDSCDGGTLACLEGCKAGYYGITCGLTCDVKCQGKSCHQKGGACKCITGYISRMGECLSTPGTYCKLEEHHCKENRCASRGRKQCLYGCTAGWFGEFCDSKCTATCACDRASGSCTDCIAGWYGEECSNSCSSGCKEGSCYRNGSCVHGCKPNSHGILCEQKCSPHCVSGCYQLSGECVQCEAGRYGSTCQYECSDGCAGANKDCDTNGNCIRGCVSGNYGNWCLFKCPQQCYGDVCNRNGTCSACKNRFSGIFCHQPCLGCIDGVCDQTTGECTEGCLRGHYGSSCKLTCENCDDGNCDQKTGECTDKSNGVQYWVGAGVTIVIIIVATGLVCMFSRLKRMDGAIYNAVKWRRRPNSAVQGASPIVAPGYTVIDDEATVTPPRICPITPISPNRRNSYIRPRYSDGSSQEDVTEAAAASLENLPPSDRRLQRSSDEWSDRPDSYVFPHYSEVNEALMTTLPQHPQGAETPAQVFINTSYPVVADVHVQVDHTDDNIATGGDINIPLIGECFGNTETEDSPTEENSRPDEENYDKVFRNHYAD